MESKQCDFGILSDKPCDKIDYVRNTCRKKLSDFDDDRQRILLWRTGFLEKKKENMNLYFYHEQLFGKVVKRKADKCCGVLKYHKRRVKPTMSVDLQMVKNLKLKRYKVLPGQNFCRQCVIKYQSIVNKDEKESDNENSILNLVPDS